jgi:ABC-2 type transport system ATP-binding protein
MTELLNEGTRRSEITLQDVSDEMRSALTTLGLTPRELGHRGIAVEVEGDVKVREVLEQALAKGARVESVLPKRETLEALFVRRAL